MLCETLCETLCDMFCDMLCETLCETLCDMFCDMLCETLCDMLCDMLHYSVKSLHVILPYQSDFNKHANSEEPGLHSEAKTDKHVPTTGNVNRSCFQYLEPHSME